MEQRDYILREIEALGKMLRAMVELLLGLKSNGATAQGIEVVNQTLQSEVDFDLEELLSVDADRLTDYLTAKRKGFDEDNLEKLAEILYLIADGMAVGDPGLCHTTKGAWLFMSTWTRLRRDTPLTDIRGLLE